MEDMVTIDGAYGEGGGQILRTSLALSALTGRSMEIYNIRAGRRNPGLRPQHLSGVRAMERICKAEVKGDRIGSQTLSFVPGRPCGGSYFLDVAEETRSAGSTSLVLQAMLPALSFAAEPSEVTISGGTHVAWSPPFDYLDKVFLPQARRLGIKARLSIQRWGWYPVGGGEIKAQVQPASRLAPLILEGPFRPEQITIQVASTLIPDHVSRRMVRRLGEQLKAEGYEAEVSITEVPATSPGCVLFLWARNGDKTAGFSGLCQRGRRAEEIANEVGANFLSLIKTGRAVEEHLADQLILYLAMAEGRSRLSVAKLSRHLLTNIWAIGHFMEAEFEVEGAEGAPGTVSVEGVGLRPQGGQE